VLATDARDGEPLGIGVRTVRPCVVNGQARPLGYLHSLRVTRRDRRLPYILREGYAALRDTRAEAEGPFDITSVMRSNSAAMHLFGAGHAGLPRYEPRETLVTVVFRARAARRPAPETTDREPELEPGSRQFMPVIAAPSHAHGLGPILSVGDSGGRPQASCRVWDQRGFKQVVGCGGATLRERVVRRLAAAGGFPRPPAPGETLALGVISGLRVSHGGVEATPALLDLAEWCAHAQGLSALALTLSERDPLLPIVRRSRRTVTMESELHLVHWGRGEADLGHEPGWLEAGLA
jgi:hypothetical protein